MTFRCDTFYAEYCSYHTLINIVVAIDVQAVNY